MENYCNYYVNISNLKYNILNIQRLLDKTTKFCAVVKADAYGVGLKNIVLGLRGLADYFAVAFIREAKRIRKIDKETNVLIFELINSEKNYIWCSENNIAVSIFSKNDALFLSKISFNNSIKVHLKVNTGLNRLGFNNVKEVKQAIKILSKNEKIKIEGVFTHFATKKNNLPYLKLQFLNFNKILNLVNYDFNIRHCSNSFATLNCKDCELDMVRVGFSMYGEQRNSDVKLLPVVKITTQILHIREIKKGDSVGYDRNFIANKKMRIGIMSIGYADGFDRRLSNNFKVLVNDKYCNIIGNVCMDVSFVDLTEVKKNVFVGSEVVLLGKDKINCLYLCDYAKALNTSEYDILLKFNRKRMNEIIIE